MTIVLHMHSLLSRTQCHWTFCLTNILQFWQTCSCWNDLVSPSRTALLWISHTLWPWPQMQSSRSRTRVKGRATKTLAAMMVAHPMPSARESISLFWTFNRCHWFKPFYGFDRAVHVCCTIKTKSWLKVTCGFIPRKIQWHIHTGQWSLVNWVVCNTYKTLYKRHMNINEMASQPWGWHRPLWWSVYQWDTPTSPFPYERRDFACMQRNYC